MLLLLQVHCKYVTILHEINGRNIVSSYVVGIAQPQNWYAKTIHKWSMITVGWRIVKPEQQHQSLINQTDLVSQITGRNMLFNHQIYMVMHNLFTRSLSPFCNTCPYHRSLFWVVPMLCHLFIISLSAPYSDHSSLLAEVPPHFLSLQTMSHFHTTYCLAHNCCTTFLSYLPPILEDVAKVILLIV